MYNIRRQLQQFCVRTCINTFNKYHHLECLVFLSSNIWCMTGFIHYFNWHAFALNDASGKEETDHCFLRVVNHVSVLHNVCKS